MNPKIRKVRQIVEKMLSCSAHDMEHVTRVYNLSLHLAKNERGIDLEVLKLAALLHDIARVKEDADGSGKTDHAVLGAEKAGKILRKLGYPKTKVERVTRCILSHRFRGGHKTESREAKILFDADKIDAIGCVGLARAFAIAGQYGEKFYSDLPVGEYARENVAENGRIRDISKHSPNLEFELKFRHVPKRLHTGGAKKIARQRLAFMERFFERMGKEIKGEL